VERQGLARALLKLRLARGLLFLPLLFLPREAALLVLYSYPLMVLTELGIVALGRSPGEAGPAQAGGDER
jgi:hypothetical protein